MVGMLEVELCGVGQAEGKERKLWEVSFLDGEKEGSLKSKQSERPARLLRALASALGSECRRLQWAWVELVRLVWKHRHSGATEGLFSCFLNSCIPEEKETLG